MDSEASEQARVIEYCDIKRIPCFHIPNGGKRDAREAYNLKRQGVKPGVPDLCIPVPNSKYHGLYIEMKRANGGTLTKHQVEWLERLKYNGYCAYCCHGADNAIALIEQYLAD